MLLGANCMAAQNFTRNMDPKLTMLLNDELKAVMDQENAIRNASISDTERARATEKVQSYGTMIMGLLEWLPALVEHLEKNKALRGEK